MIVFNFSRLALVCLTVAATSRGALEYRYVPDWPSLPDGQEYLGKAHGEIRVDAAGNIYASTEDPKNPIMVFGPDGSFKKIIAQDYPGIHGFVIQPDETGQEHIYAAHLPGSQIVKLTLDGKCTMSIGIDVIPRQYTRKKEGRDFFPVTAVDVAPNGDLYAVNGYGSDHIFRFSPGGKLKEVFGGRNQTPAGLKNCHKIFIDRRYDPVRILACDRGNGRLIHFDLSGNYLGELAADLRRPSSIDFHNGLMAVAEISGRVVVLDKSHQIVSVLSENLEQTEINTNQTPPEKWKAGIVTSPHGICFDADGNVLVSEWNRWGRILRFNRQ